MKSMLRNVILMGKESIKCWWYSYFFLSKKVFSKLSL